jgi:aldose sugar dehydrogenase
MIEWMTRPRWRGVLTAAALGVGSILGAGVLIAGGILVREGTIRDFGPGVELIAYPVQGGQRGASAIAFAPDGEMIVALAGGRIRVFESGEEEAAELAVSTLQGSGSSDEPGIFGLAVDRAFADNRYVYVCAARTTEGAAEATNQLVRMVADDAWKLSVDVVLAELTPTAPDRNGCAVGIDADGNLWVGMGDARRPGIVLQPESLFGRVLRIPSDVARGSPEAPLDSDELLGYVVATGVRNPRSIALADQDGALYLADGGPGSDGDEINELDTPADFGWPCLLGTEPWESPRQDGAEWEQECAELAESQQLPAWSTPAGSRTGIGGMSVLQGAGWEPWDGWLMLSAAGGGELLLLEPTEDGFVERDGLFDRWGWRPGAMTRGPNDDLYVAVTTGGASARIMRIEPTD